MAKVQLGKVLLEQRETVGTPDGNNLPLIGVSNKDGLLLSRQQRLPDLSRYKVLQRGWFAYNPMRINVGSIGYADGPEKTGIISPDYVVFSCTDRILPEYFFHFIKSQVGLREIARNTGGSVRERLYFRNLAKIEIELPSVQEQEIIVRSLNYRVGLLNELTREISMLEGDVQLLRSAILERAVQGKLVTQLAGDEPAGQLLQRIKAEKERRIKAGQLKKEKPLPPIRDEEVPFDLPEGWMWCRLGELGQFTGGGTPSTGVPEYWNGSIPWITPKDMKSDILDDSEDKVSVEGVNNSSAKLIAAGSVLIVGRSGILKRTLPVSINSVECIVNQDLKAVVPYLPEMAKYIQIMLQGFEGFILKNLVKYGMTVHSLMYKEFELQPFPMPSLDLQKRILDKVEKCQWKINDLQNQLIANHNQAIQLLQSTLRETFEESKLDRLEAITR